MGGSAVKPPIFVTPPLKSMTGRVGSGHPTILSACYRSSMSGEALYQRGITDCVMLSNSACSRFMRNGVRVAAERNEVSNPGPPHSKWERHYPIPPVFSDSAHDKGDTIVGVGH